MALTALRDQLADLVRNHDNRDSQGRFTPTGRDNLTHQPLTHEQHAAAIATLGYTPTPMPETISIRLRMGVGV